MNLRTGNDEQAARAWTGPVRRYDIVKEFVVALMVIGLLSVGLAAAFTSPDEHALTFEGWAKTAPDNFYATTVSELAGTSGSAGYGPPYNNASTGLAVGPLRPQKWVGVRIPVDTAQDFVLTPLSQLSQPVDVAAAVHGWDGATTDQRSSWATAYDNAVQATADTDGVLHLDHIAVGDYGPVPALASGLLTMARSGSLDSALVGQGGFYPSNATRQILFLGDGSYLDDAGTAQHLQGNTWGMMNGIGSYPGQPWLWWASAWYQIPVFNPADNATTTTSLQDNADEWIFLIIGLLTLGMILLPYIPGVRSLPRWIPVHRLIWRDYYRKYGNRHLL